MTSRPVQLVIPARSRRGRILVALLAGAALQTACSQTPSATSSPSLAESVGQPGAVACGPIDLVTPSGARVDLTGTWRGITGIHYVRQVGMCVFWIGLSDYPGDEAGEQWMLTFRGELASDFTLRGEWAWVVRPIRPGLTGPDRGEVTFQLAVSAEGGTETLTLRSFTRSEVGPYRAAGLTYEGPLPVPAPL